jgi:hypothetical protein
VEEADAPKRVRTGEFGRLSLTISILIQQTFVGARERTWTVDGAIQDLFPSQYYYVDPAEQSQTKELIGAITRGEFCFFLRVYAHFAAIVQSSGMGKSRTVDELAKGRFVIPLNLRGAKSTGGWPLLWVLHNALIPSCRLSSRRPWRSGLFNQF